MRLQYDPVCLMTLQLFSAYFWPNLISDVQLCDRGSIHYALFGITTGVVPESQIHTPPSPVHGSV